jgi:hypothetical protein
MHVYFVFIPAKLSTKATQLFSHRPPLCLLIWLATPDRFQMFLALLW